MRGFFQKFNTSSPKSVTNSLEPIANKKQLQTKKIPHKSKKDEATNFNDEFLGHEITTSLNFGEFELEAAEYLKADLPAIKLEVKNEIVSKLSYNHNNSFIPEQKAYILAVLAAFDQIFNSSKNLISSSSALKFQPPDILKSVLNKIDTNVFSKEDINEIKTKVSNKFEVKESIKLYLERAIAGYVNIFFDVINQDLLPEINRTQKVGMAPQIEEPGLHAEEQKVLPSTTLSGDKCDNDC